MRISELGYETAWRFVNVANKWLHLCFYIHGYTLYLIHHTPHYKDSKYNCKDSEVQMRNSGKNLLTNHKWVISQAEATSS